MDFAKRKQNILKVWHELLCVIECFYTVSGEAVEGERLIFDIDSGVAHAHMGPSGGGRDILDVGENKVIAVLWIAEGP